MAPSSVLSVYHDKICIKIASHHLLLYVVYMCQKSLNFTYAFKCYQQNLSAFTLAGPPCTLAQRRRQVESSGGSEGAQEARPERSGVGTIFGVGLCVIGWITMGVDYG